MTFYVQAPIFVFREFMRHRIASYNEESGRYRELRPVFYVPGPQRRRAILIAVLAVGVLVLIGGVGSHSTVAQRAASILHPLSEQETGGRKYSRKNMIRN